MFSALYGLLSEISLNRNKPEFPFALRFQLRIRQTVSLGKALDRFWPTVLPAAPGGASLAVSRPCQSPRNAVCPIDSPDTSPSPPLQPKPAPPRGPPIPLAPAASQSCPACAKQPPRQVSLHQEKPIVAGVFNQTARGFHQPLPQAGQRSAGDPCRQRQPPPQIAQVVGDNTQPRPHLVGLEAVASTLGSRRNR